MQRILEPELMEEHEQAKAYALADFENSNSLFVNLFNTKFPDHPGDGYTLDLGCGPGDIMIRMAKKYPKMLLHGVDGSEEMLEFALKDTKEASLSERVKYYKGIVPGVRLPVEKYQSIISNSLLHHLHKPQVLWEEIRKKADKDAYILIMDLFRPESTQAAAEIVEKYSGDEPEVLKRDFYNSLLAAFTVDEIKDQLKQMNLIFDVELVSDRHVLVWGRYTV